MWLPRQFALLTILLATVAAPLAAQRRVVVKGPKGNVHVVKTRRHVVFRVEDHGIFRNYFHTHRIVVTPLRPEVARLVVVGKPLPPPTVVVRTPIPHDLLVLLPPPPQGYTIFIVGDRIVMVDDEGLVADIVEDAFR